MGKASEEVEIKLPAESPDKARRLLTRNGFKISSRRVFEANSVWDTPGQTLRSERKLLRLRQAGDRFVLTFKGTPSAGPHKKREEVEVGVSDFKSMQRILERLGYQLSFRYEKYRTEYSEAGAAGVATVDETPVGTFLELEGPARWIDRTAKRLGFRREDYITKSYGTLYLEHCRDSGLQPSNMVFQRPVSRKRPSK